MWCWGPIGTHVCHFPFTFQNHWIAVAWPWKLSYFPYWHLTFHSLMNLTAQDKCIYLFSKWLHGSHMKASETQCLNSRIYSLNNLNIYFICPLCSFWLPLDLKLAKSCVFNKHTPGWLFLNLRDMIIVKSSDSKMS